ncbi:MAG: hypothetical protein IKX36_06460 [Prevotella sp.]|nr:hypothetical protein [Prevotella sp.]
MTDKDTEILIQKYLNGDTTAEEERLLALEVSREDAPKDWKIIAGMLGELNIDEALFDQIMAERKRKPRILRLWPWVVAACVAALLIVFLAPPKEEVSTQPKIAKVEPQEEIKEEKTHVEAETHVEPKMGEPQNTEEKPLQTRKVKHRNVSKRIAKASEKTVAKQVVESGNSAKEFTKVEESAIFPYEDARLQFAEQAKALRERGNRVIQRVSMNRLPSNNYQLNDL